MLAKYTIMGDFNHYPDLDFDSEDSVNLFRITDPNGKKQDALLNTPGLKLEVEVIPGSTAESRALWVFENQMYGVFGSEVVVFAADLAPQLIGQLESDAGYVSITNNNGGQVIFVDGLDGYIYTPSAGSFQKIVSTDFPAKPLNVAYLDTYFAIPSGESQTFQLSANNDGTQWNAFFDSAQIQTYPGVNKGVGVVNERLYFFKDTSTEIWWNPGDADFPLRKDTNLNFNYGCLATDSIAADYGYLFWLAQDKSGAASVMMSTGYIPQRISTQAVESTISQFTKPADVACYIYKYDERIFYVMNWTTDDYTLVVDAATGRWHRMQMLEKPAISGVPNSGKTRHIGNCHAYFNGVHYIGSYKSATLYSFSRNYPDNAGEAIQRIRTGRPFSLPNYFQFQIDAYQVDMQPGLGQVNGIYVDPIISLSVSKDGGHVFGNKQLVRIGRVGQRQTRMRWLKKGIARSWVPRIEITAAIAPFVIMGDALTIQPLNQ